MHQRNQIITTKTHNSADCSAITWFVYKQSSGELYRSRCCRLSRSGLFQRWLKVKSLIKCQVWLHFSNMIKFPDVGKTQSCIKLQIMVICTANHWMQNI